jgi:non-specific serine/threonine protein kinase
MDPETLARLVPEQENARLALAWCEEHDDSDALLELSAMLYGLWLARGLHREGLSWLNRALERSSHTASVAHTHALMAAGHLAILQGDYAHAAAFSAKGVALARELDDPTLGGHAAAIQVGQALTIAGLLAHRLGEQHRAEDLATEAYDRLSELDERVPGAIQDTGYALLLLACIALVQEQFDPAERWCITALDCFQRAGNDWGMSEAQATLGGIRYCLGDIPRAAALYGESLDRAHDRNLPILVVSALFGLASVAATVGRPDVGARLHGAAAGLTASLGAPTMPRDDPVIERGLRALRTALGEERFVAGREAGRIMNGEQAIAEAKAIVAAVASTASANEACPR